MSLDSELETATNESSIARFRDAFAQAKHIIVIAGAGLSAASGQDITLPCTPI